MSAPEDPGVQVERPVLTLRRHGRALVLPVLLLIAVAGAAGYFVGTLPEAWMNLAAGIGAGALALLLGIGPVLAWLTTRATISNRRVILRRGVFVQHRSEVPLSRVREVRSRRGLLQRIFGSGDVELLVGAEAPVRLRDVPGPGLVVDALQELIEQDYLRTAAEQAAYGQAAQVQGGYGRGAFAAGWGHAPLPPAPAAGGVQGAAAPPVSFTTLIDPER